MKLFLIIFSSFLLLFVPVYVIQVAGKLALLLIVISWLYSRLSWKFLSIRSELPIIRGFLYEKNQVSIVITNSSFFPISMLAIRDDIAGLNITGNNFGVFFLAARSQMNFEYQIWSTTRGMYSLGPLHIAGSDPLGLFPWSIEIAEKRLVFIYPSVNSINFIAHHGIAGGPIKSHHPMFLDTTQIRSIRPYETGDDPRHIHWKATARMGTIQVSEFTRNLNIPFYIILNLCSSDFHNKRKGYHLERIVEAAAAFMGEASTKQFAVGFLTNGLIPLEARSHLLRDEGELPGLHLPICPALQASSQILSMLSVIGFGEQTLISIFENLQFHLAPRCIIISPPLLKDDFTALCVGFPRSCRLDFWFLDEHVLRNDRVDHRSAPLLPGIKIYKLPEYGDDLLNPEAQYGK